MKIKIKIDVSNILAVIYIVLAVTQGLDLFVLRSLSQGLTNMQFFMNNSYACLNNLALFAVAAILAYSEMKITYEKN